jgi:hypothetical protein
MTRLTTVLSICRREFRAVRWMSGESLPMAMLKLVRTACISVSPCTMKCSAVVTVSNARNTASWTLLSVTSAHLATRVTTCAPVQAPA